MRDILEVDKLKKNLKTPISRPSILKLSDFGITTVFRHPSNHTVWMEMKNLSKECEKKKKKKSTIKNLNDFLNEGELKKERRRNGKPFYTKCCLIANQFPEFFFPNHF